MLFNPYEVLGIPSNADDDAVKKAYRSLSRKYHPDANINNPNQEQAEEQFKKVQEAYEQIMKERSGESNDFGGAFGGGFGSYGDFGRREESKEPLEFQAAGNYIRSGHYKEALHVLSEITERNGKWYYYSAIANSGIGNNIDALAHARQAVSLEPENQQYRILLQQFESGGQWYTRTSGGYNPQGGLGGDLCCKLWLANAICSCLCGYPRIC